MASSVLEEPGTYNSPDAYTSLPSSHNTPVTDESNPQVVTSDLSAVAPDDSQSVNGTKPRSTFSRLTQTLRKPYSRKIFVACGLVILPMLAFTIAIVWVVFAHSLDRTSCPYPELCPGPELLNITSTSKYYIDYPAGRLAFVSSLSATISFMLVSILMMIYAYTTSSKLLRSTEEDSRRRLLPSPYQISVLLRILNAEVLALCELGWERLSKIFWDREESTTDKPSRTSASALQRAIMMLLLCLSASILIQAADTYFHIAIASTAFVQVLPGAAEQHLYSRRLAPWCINRQGVGTANNKNFWSCSLTYTEELELMSPANNTLVNEYMLGSSRDYALNYTDEDGAQFAIVGAAAVPSNTDWKASSFAVSTKCSAIERGACEVGDTRLDFPTFNCTKERSGMDLSGQFNGYAVQQYYFDVHKYIKDANAFNKGRVLGMDAIKGIAPQLTDDDVDSVFMNPFRYVHVLATSYDDEQRRKAFANDSRVWHIYSDGTDHLWLLCNSTVWDVTYTAVGRKVTHLEKRKSNGTMTGIASFTNFPYLFLGAEQSQATAIASTAETPEKYIETYVRELSKIFTRNLAAQTVTDKALLAQVRKQLIVTELPAAALWVLVAANMSFALLAIVLTVMALRNVSDDVHQVHTRLGIAGLAAALFENIHAERAVDDSRDLFPDEKTKSSGGVVKKVGVESTDTGGAKFTVIEV